jgi:predicted ATPase
MVRLVGLGPFEDLSISFVDGEGAPRRRVVLFGGEGVGKTSILAAIAATRPGHAIAQLSARGNASPSPFVVADWLLADDDRARPHPLRVVSPNAKLEEPEDAALLRRREQALFERRAAEGGYALVCFSGARWFSRTPVLLTTPERTILRYDLRASASFDDATRADLARETKQVLSFFAIAAALSQNAGEGKNNQRLGMLDQAMREIVGALLEDAGIRYLGVEPVTLEPLFEVNGSRLVDFDDLPRSARHLVAFGVLTVRTLAAAYPTKDVRDAEGVVLLDDIEIHQDLWRERSLPALLEQVLPRVQWIVTTSSPAVALGCDVADVLALRRSTSGRVELYEGREAMMH